MNPRVAISAPLFSLIPFEEMLDKVEKEFAIWEMITEGNCRLQRIKGRLKELLETSELRFTVHAPISDINLASINPKMLETARKEIAETIEIAGKLGITPVTVHIGYISPLTILNKDKAREIARESVVMLDKVAREHGVPVAAENMPRTRWAIFTDPEELLEAIDGTEWGLCLDVGHANISGNLDRFLELKDRFLNMHIHDNNGKYDEHLVLGRGGIELKAVVDALEPKYRGNWVIECTEFEQGVESKAILERWLAR